LRDEYRRFSRAKAGPEPVRKAVRKGNWGGRGVAWGEQGPDGSLLKSRELLKNKATDLLDNKGSEVVRIGNEATVDGGK